MKTIDCNDLSLKKVCFCGNVMGMFGTFEIEQVFVNNTKDLLEVNYTFPIIDTATITGFSVTVGENVIKGICKDKKEAFKEYHQNIVNGNSAYMLNRETENIFNVSVGKVKKDEEVRVKITYIDMFKIVDNEIKIIIPTLITPRYKSNITKNLNYGKVDYTCDFNICINKMINVCKIDSMTHDIKISESDKEYIVETSNYDMSKDFNLIIKLKEELNSNAVFSKTKSGEYIVCLSFMPEILDSYEDSEKEYIFIVDTSGSMSGKKLTETKKAIKQCLKHLDEGDKFNIVPFDTTYFAFEMKSVAVNNENLKRAEEFIDSLDASGGTEILLPIKFALYEQSDDKVILLFTDGQVGNENEILKFIAQNIKESKLFAFGIDSNINTSFIRNISRVGNGKCEFIHIDEKIDNKIMRTFARIQTPLVEDLTLSYGKNKVLYELKEENRLFNYEFYNILVKLQEIQDDISLTGKIAGKIFEWKILKKNIKPTTADLEKIFAKLQIDRLEEYIMIMPIERKQIYEKMIIDISEKYGIATKYTAFIGVYEREDKLFQIPKIQNIILSDGFAHEKEAKNNYFFSSDLDIPTFLRKNKKVIDDDKKELIQILEKYFKEKKIHSIRTFILFAIYFYKNQKDVLAEEDIIRFLENNIDDINKDKRYMDLVYLLYKNSGKQVMQYIYNIFSYEYKKVIDTSMNYKVNIGIEKLDKNKIEENINTEIDKVLWSLI